MGQYDIGTHVFGDWEIVKELGQGSYGTVYELQKTDYGITTKSALKVLRIPRSISEVKQALNEGMDEQSVTSYFQDEVDRLVKEIMVMAALKSHPNVVSYEDHKVEPHAGEIGWDILIRMELLTSFQDYKLQHPMDEAEVRRLGIELSDALVFCQKQGLIHRDIKPGNIFASETGHFKLGDFGVARAAEKTLSSLSKQGTESYMAPEVYLGQPYGASVDIYSLGLVLYQLVNGGRLPFFPPVPEPITFADRENAQLKRIKGVPLPPPRDASPEFAAIILKACAFDPQERYRTAAELLEALNVKTKAGAFPPPSKKNLGGDLPAPSEPWEELDGDGTLPVIRKVPLEEDSGGRTLGPQHGSTYSMRKEDLADRTFSTRSTERTGKGSQHKPQSDSTYRMRKEDLTGGSFSSRRVGETPPKSQGTGGGTFSQENIEALFGMLNQVKAQKEASSRPNREKISLHWEKYLPKIATSQVKNCYFAPNIPVHLLSLATEKWSSAIRPSQVLGVLSMCPADKKTVSGLGKNKFIGIVVTDTTIGLIGPIESKYGSVVVSYQDIKDVKTVKDSVFGGHKLKILTNRNDILLFSPNRGFVDYFNFDQLCNALLQVRKLIQ